MRFWSKLIGGILTFIFRLVTYTTLSICLALGLYIYSQSHPEFADAISDKVTSLGQYAYQQGWIIQTNTEQTSEEGFVTDHVLEHTDGVRWQKASAKVYINTQDETYYQAYLTAIKNWNDTGVFTFDIVTEETQANVIANVISDSATSAAGVAESIINPLTNRFISVTVSLNSYYLSDPAFGYDMNRIVHTAEHELGHAIGLNHNEAESVMQSAGSYYGIQNMDIEAVRALYVQ